MNILNIKGGIGNQIIQISYAVNFDLLKNIFFIDSTSSLFNTSRKFYFGSYLKNKIPFSILIFKLLNFFLFKKINYITDVHNLNVCNIKYAKNCINIFNGYFQDISLNLNFTWYEFDKIDLYSHYSINPTAHLVAIHIRRGDYLNNINKEIYYDINLNYYLDAISYINNQLKNVVYIIFSDDYIFAKNNFKGDNYIIYKNSGDDLIDHNHMCSCDHFIIANSTYSYTAAMIGSSSHSIKVAPYLWYRKRNRPNLFDFTWMSF